MTSRSSIGGWQRPPVRPTSPTILFENMNKRQREEYSKALLLRQRSQQDMATKQAQTSQSLWGDDPTLSSQRPLRTVAQSQVGGGGDSSRRSTGAGGVASSFVVAERGDVSVSRGGAALYGATAEAAHAAKQFTQQKGGKTFVTTMPRSTPQTAARPLPFPVLWQVKSQDEEALCSDYAAGGGGDSGYEKQLRNLNGSRLKRVMGRREDKGIRNSDVEQSRRRVVDALQKARRREKVLQEQAMLRAHTHDPGAETRPVPRVGRRAAPGDAAAHPALSVGGARAVGPIEWDGEDQILASGPAASEGEYVPLQYLELVKVEQDEGALPGEPDQRPPAPGVRPSTPLSGGGYALDKPHVRFVGGGFVKSRPGREASQDDYLELLRVAEVLDALNQVEGNVLQQRSQQLVSFDDYLKMSQEAEAVADDVDAAGASDAPQESPSGTEPQASAAAVELPFEGLPLAEVSLPTASVEVALPQPTAEGDAAAEGSSAAAQLPAMT